MNGENESFPIGGRVRPAAAGRVLSDRDIMRAHVRTAAYLPLVRCGALTAAVLNLSIESAPTALCKAWCTPLTLWTSRFTELLFVLSANLTNNYNT